MNSLLTFFTLLATLVIVVSSNKTTAKANGGAKFVTYQVDKVTPPASRGIADGINEEKAIKPVTQNSVYITSGFDPNAFPDQKFMPNENDEYEIVDGDDDDDDNDDDDEDAYSEDDDDDLLNVRTTMKPKRVDEPPNNTAGNTNNILVFNASQLPEEYAELNLKNPAVHTKVGRIYSAIFKNIVQKLIEAKMSNSFALDKDVLAAFEKSQKEKPALKKNADNVDNGFSSSDILLIIGAKVAGQSESTAKAETPLHYLALIDSSPLDESSLQLDGKDGDKQKLTYKLTGLLKVNVTKLHK